MALTAIHNDTKFSVGDAIRVSQKIQEGDKTRTQVFEGMVIGIKGRGKNKSFTVRRIGAQKVGIERIFPIDAPVVEKVEVVKKGGRGVRRAKLYYTRDKSRKEIELIYSRATKREKAKDEKVKPKPKKTTRVKKSLKTPKKNK